MLLKRRKKKTQIPFWIQILAILLVGVLASVIVLFVVPSLNYNNEEPGTTETSTQPDTGDGEYTVTFAYQNGTVIEKKTVTKGKGVFPPMPKGDDVFRGWSGAFNSVQSDVEVHPIFHSITEDNLFYFNSVYVQEGEEFTLDVYVGGRVNVSSGKLTLNYDPEVLEYKHSDDNGISSVSETKAGELVINFSSDTNFDEKTMLSQITFFAKEKDAYATQVDLSAKDVKVLSGGQEMSADFATINNKIYFLQEVEA